MNPAARHLLAVLLFLVLPFPPMHALAGFFYSGTTPGTVPWTNGIVPYAFATNLTTAQKQTYLDGLREWELAANVQFVLRSNQTQYVLFKYDPSGPNLVSGANPQMVEVNSLSRGQVCHEMGHSFGFTHEHIRPDRTPFITVLTNNISGGNAFWFDIDATGVTNGAYDFESVMHFARDLFSIQPGVLDTLQPKPGYERFQPRLGNYALSRGDRAALAALYGPPAVPLTNIVTTTSDGGAGSLRAALYYATDHPGTTITFNIPTSDSGYSNGVYTIRLTGFLPPLVTDGTVIDGTTQSGFTNKPLIVLDGSAIIPEAYGPGTFTGLLLYAANCTVKNLSFQNFNWNGLTLRYADATNNTIAGCWCGVDYTGTNAAPNAFQGILIYDGASRNIIAGTNATGRNLLSGNTQYGIWISGSNTTGNVIRGSYIGTDAGGTMSLSNQLGGIGLFDRTKANLIGGSTTNAGNLISGNKEAGIWIVGSGVESNVVSGNLIGLAANGTSALPNSFVGIYVLDGARFNRIGGTQTGERNVISGNISEGLRLADPGTAFNSVLGNLVGTDAAGMIAVPNGFAGVTLYNGTVSNLIGGSTSADRNQISGNATYNVVLADAGTRANTIAGNWIGLNATGSGTLGTYAGVLLASGAQANQLGMAPAGNVISGHFGPGIFVTDPGTSSNRIEGNLIGTAPDGLSPLGNWQGVLFTAGASNNVLGLGLNGTGAGNRIGQNYNSGVQVESAAAGNTIRGNNIFSNAALGINVAGGGENGFGVTANDAGDSDSGANGLQNFPIPTNAAAWGPAMHLAGTFHSRSNRTYLLDFYRSAGADPSSYGEGEVHLGSITVATDSSGNATFSFGASGLATNEIFTATATDTITGDTSEFSVGIPGNGATTGPGAPSLTPIPSSPAIGFSLNLSASSGWYYRLQGSTNLTAWTDLTNFVANLGSISFTDAQSTNLNRRFYRLVSP